jgi:hypothetical protein
VQERVGLAALGLPVALEVALAVAEHGVVLRMPQDHRERHRFERRERGTRAVLRPEVEEELPGLVARRVEHQRGLGRTDGFFGAASGFIAANFFFSGNSHCG